MGGGGEIVLEDFKEFKCGERSPYNPNVTYLGSNGSKEKGGKKLYLKCDICASDSELYGDGVCYTDPATFRSGGGCYCSPNKKLTEEQLTIKIERYCKDIGYTFVGFVTEDKQMKSKIILTCDKGHTYSTCSVGKFIQQHRRCPVCAGNRRKDYTEDSIRSMLFQSRGHKYTYKGLENVTNNKSKFIAVCPLHGDFKTDMYHHTIRKQDCPHPECSFRKISNNRRESKEYFVSNATKIHGDRYDYTETEYTGVFKKVEILCKDCDKVFTQTARDHLNGCGCNLCQTNHFKYLYLFTVYDDGVPLCVKAGIAVDYNLRLVRQNRGTRYKVEPFMVWEVEHPYLARDCERIIKQTYKGNFLTSWEYSDGFSETFSIKDLDDIIKIMDQYGVRVVIDGI